jgi:hypothetical protein
MPTSLISIELSPMIGFIVSYSGDLGVLSSSSFLGLDISSAMSCLVTMIMGGVIGRRSTNMTGGRPMVTHISSKILSEEVIAVSYSSTLLSKPYLDGDPADHVARIHPRL